MTGTPPKFIRSPADINTLAPSQDPQEPGVLLRPSSGYRPLDPVEKSFQKRSTQRQEGLDRDLLRIYRATVDVDPEEAAEAEKLGLDLGIDAHLVEGNIPKVRKLWAERQLRMQIRSGGNEAVYRSMMDPQFAKIAHDDLDNLSAVDKTVAQFTAGRLGFNASILDYKRSQQGGILSSADEDERDRIAEEMTRLPHGSGGEGLAGIWYGGTRMAGGMAETMAYSAAAAGAAMSTAAVLGSAGPQAAFVEEFFTVPAAGAWAGLSTMGVMSGRQIAGEAYGEMRRLGITHGLAKEQSEMAGFIGGALEAGVFGKVSGKIAGKAVAGWLTKSAAKESLSKATKAKALRGFLLNSSKGVISETSVELAQEALSWGLTSSALSQEGKADDRGDFYEHMQEVLEETLRGVAIISSFGPAIQYRVDTRRARTAVQTGEFLSDFGKAVKESKVAKRSPSRFLDFLSQSVDQSGGPKSVLFDIDTFAEMMTESGFTMRDLESNAPEVAAELRQAEAQGLGEFEIPTATFGAKFLTTPFGQALIPHAKTEAGGMTAAEGIEFQEGAEEMTKQGQALLADAEKTNTEFREGVAAAKKQMHADLTAAGVSPSEAAVEATLYSHTVAVMSDRLGITPAEFQEKHGLEFTRDDVGIGSESLAQAGAEAQFYSALSRAVEALPTKSATAAGWKQALTGLAKKGKVKKDELFWTGIDDWIETQGGKVTKEQVTEFLASNGVRVETVTLGNQPANPNSKYALPEVLAAADRATGVNPEELILAVANDGAAYDALMEKFPELVDDESWEYTVVEDIWGKITKDAKFEQYTLPGGINYREVLVTLPGRQLTSLPDGYVVIPSEQAIKENYSSPYSALGKSKFVVVRPDRTPPWRGYYGTGNTEAEAVANSLQSIPIDFKSPHFDEKNIVAHLRLNDRVGPDGERVLFVEEVQSDWAQEGRKQGFGQNAVPTAPFVESTKGWLNLALKQVAMMGVSEGYDQVAFINGEQSAARYDLSKQVDSIDVDSTAHVEGGRMVVIVMGERTIGLGVSSAGVVESVSPESEVALDGKALDDIVGKEIAERVMAIDGFETLQGEGLKIGGEGMKTFYDSIVPKAVSKLFGKKGDVEVVGYAPEHHMEDQSSVFNRQLTLKITDKLRESIQTEGGLPLFAGNQRGRYIPSEQRAILTKDANPSTVLHEMLHHFANVMLRVASEGAAPKDGVLEQLGDYDILGAIASYGGIKRESAEEYVGADVRDAKRVLGKGSGIKPVFRRKGGLTMDQMQAQLAADGWFIDPDMGMEEMTDMITSALQGSDVRHPHAEFDVGEVEEQELQGRPGAPTQEEQAELDANDEDRALEVEYEIGEEDSAQRASEEAGYQESTDPVDVARPPAPRNTAPKAILEDVDTMMTFWKIDGETAADRLATWNSMSFKEQAPHQESLAYNYELWLFTGAAPTAGLRRLFAKIRTFMLNVYTSLTQAERQLSGTYKANFGVDLPGMTPELRQMFDSMVAGERAAHHAETVREMGPMFETLELFVEAGGTAAEYGRYQLALDNARQQLETDLSVDSMGVMQWQTRAKGKVLKALQREQKERRKEVRSEMEVEVANEPVYKILDMLKDEKNGLDRSEVAAMIGDEAAKKLGTSKVRKTGGFYPDDVAGLMPDAFPTGRHLVDAMVAALPLNEAIEARTSLEMEIRYGDPMSEGAIQDRVERAIHSESRSRFAAIELKFLSKSTKPTRVIEAAAEEAARKILAGRALNDMSPHKFAQQEARSNAAAHQAMKTVSPRKASEDGSRPAVEGRGPDPQAAIEHRRRALLYNKLTKLALEAKAEVGKAKSALFRSVAKGDEKAIKGKGRTVDYVMAARTLLAQYGLLPDGKIDRAVDFMQRMKEYVPEMFEVFQEELGDAQRAGADIGFDHRDMTLDQFRVLRQQVESLWYLSKRENEIEVEGKRQALRGIVTEMREGSLDAHARKDSPGRNSAVPDGWWTDKKDQMMSIRATLTKVEHWARYLDGGKSGPMTKYLYRPIEEAVNAYRAAAVIHTKEFVDLLKVMRASGLLSDSAIEATELGIDPVTGKPVYTFGGEGSSAGGMTELLGALLHTHGNQSNHDKFLVAGRGGKLASWADVTYDENGKVVGIDDTKWMAFVSRLVDEGVLKKEHFEFIQKTWGLMEKMKPALQTAHIKLEGYPFKEVAAKPFSITFPDGTTENYKGGYVPAGVDHARAREIANAGPADLTEEQLKGEFNEGLPKVSAGMTMTRVEGYRERPLSMSLDSIVAHIDKALRYAHVAPAAVDVARIIKDKEFRAAMSAADPKAIDEILLPFLDRGVTQTLYKQGNPAHDKFFKNLRRITGVKIMFGSVVNSLQQFTGLINAMIYVNPRHLTAGMVAAYRHPIDTTKMIVEKSTMMDDRMNSQMFELTDDMRAATLVKSKGETIQSKAVGSAYFLQIIAQNMVDRAVWVGAYNQNLESAPEGLSMFEMERHAVREADSAVRMSQGDFSPQNQAAYEKGTPAGRSWTQFTSYFNTVGNQVGYAQKGQKIITGLVAFSAPMIVAQAISMTFYDRWSDEDDDGHVDAGVWQELFVGSQIRGATAMLPGYGPAAVNLYDRAFGDRPFADRVAAAPALSTLGSSLYGAAMAAKAIAEGEDIDRQNVKDAMTAIVMFFPWGGAALAPLVKPTSYGYGAATGEVEPTSAADAARGLVTGYASEDSRR